jgi:hypothetical protein
MNTINYKCLGPLRVYLSLVSANKLFIRKPILNAYKTVEKCHTLTLIYRFLKVFQKGGVGTDRRAGGSVT